MARMSLEVVAPTGPVAPPTDPETAAITCLLSVMEAHEAQDPATVGRCRRIAIHAVGTARALLLPAAEIETIRLAALFCNLGLVRVPGTVLHKAEDLNESERQLIRQHPRLSAEMLATVPQLRQALPLVLYHHEFWNGEGYPYALREEQIPLGARIIHVAEAYEALTHARPYRRAYTAEEAEQMLIKGIDELFESRVVRAFLRQQRRADATDETLDRWMAALHDARFLPVMAGAEVRTARPKHEPVQPTEKRVAAILRRPMARRASSQLSS
ncbi:MAG: HD domain-containing phosphohydrolase [Chloroflexia bacterium]